MINIWEMNKKVICDLCGEDFTNSTEKGGILFNSNAVCPNCLPEFMESISKYNEWHFIKDKALEDETFCDFVLRIRFCGCNVLN